MNPGSELAPMPFEVLLRNAVDRAAPRSYWLRSTSVADLVGEAIELAKLTSTQERDVEAIRAEYKLRSAKIANEHAENLLLINREYGLQELQIQSFHEVVKLLISAGQFGIVQQLANRLGDILAVSPLDKIFAKRK